MKTHSPGASPHAVQTCHELLVWVITHIDGFPRARRFTLGERIESGLLRVLEHLVRAAYSRDKQAPLAAANTELELLRHLWRAAWELRAVSGKCYEQGARRIDELGREVGGWLRYVGQQRR